MDQKINKKDAAVERRVADLSEKILFSWRLSLENLLECGRCLLELKTILPRERFIFHLRTEFSMSEVHAHRLIALHVRFHNLRSKRLLAAKPSVLYLLAMTDDLTKVERLAGGGKTKIGGRWKSIDELTVKDASQIKSNSANANGRTDQEMDSARAKNIHRELSSALLRFEDAANDIVRYRAEGRSIEQPQRVKKYIEDVIVCLKKAHKNL